jgi:acetyltransferase-like isoleucine patch superfamily enzyme
MDVRIRSALKSVAFWLATLAVSPALLSYQFRALLLGRDRALEGSSQALSLVPGVAGQYLRRAFYARVLAFSHPSVTIEFGALLSKTGARLDENVYIGSRCNLGLVHVERDALIGPGVNIPSGRLTHGTDDADQPIREQAGSLTMVTIGEGAWIGSASTVMADVGRHTVVGAGAVVTQPIPDRVVAVGCPARPIRSRKARRDAAREASRPSLELATNRGLR